MSATGNGKPRRHGESDGHQEQPQIPPVRDARYDNPTSSPAPASPTSLAPFHVTGAGEVYVIVSPIA